MRARRLLLPLTQAALAICRSLADLGVGLIPYENFPLDRPYPSTVYRPPISELKYLEDQRYLVKQRMLY